MRDTFTRSLMTASALALGLLGLAATFLPQEILRAAGAEPDPVLVLVVQLLGALYLGFAMLDWMGRENLIGGIYSRPVAVGNLAHYVIAGFALLKSLTANALPWPFWLLGLAYAAFAVAFGVVLFRHPVATASPAGAGAPS